VYLASYLSAAPTCGPITVAVVRSDGVVIEQVDEWVACD